MLSFNPLSGMYEVLYDDGEGATEPLDFGDKNDPKRRNRQCGCVRQSGWTPPLELSKRQAVSVKQAKAAADDRQKLARDVRRSQKQAAKRISDEKAGRIKKRHPLVVAQKASEKNRLTWLAKREKFFARERTVAEAAAELVAAEVAVMTPATSGLGCLCWSTSYRFALVQDILRLISHAYVSVWWSGSRSSSDANGIASNGMTYSAVGDCDTLITASGGLR